MKSYCVKEKKMNVLDLVLEWYVKSKNKVDGIAAYHDICYDRGINKGDCDKQNS